MNMRGTAFKATVAALVVFLALRFLFGPGIDTYTLIGAILIGLIGGIAARREWHAPATTAADPAALIADPPLTRLLFNSVQSAPIWLAVRIFVGLQWLEAGLHKYNGAGWLDGGTALKGYWERAVAVSDTGKGLITFDWYRGFLQFMLDRSWYSGFAYLITFGEILVGIGLLVGAVVGIAAFFGALMNMSFQLAGSASSNPVLFTLAVLLMLAWKVAGWYGVDRYLLPALGAPWSPGWAVRKTTASTTTT